MKCLVEKSNDLSCDMLSSGLLVIHDTSTGGQDNVAELTRRQQLDNPLLKVAKLDVVAGRDDTGLVEAAVELDDNLVAAVVVDLLEFTNVSCAQNLSARVRQECSDRINM